MGAAQATKKRFVQPPGYTQVPNVLFDEIMPVASAAEWKVTSAIARVTFGWGKEERLLSNADLEALTGLSRPSVIKGAREAEERGFVGRREVSPQKFVYGLRVKKIDPLEDAKGSKNFTPGCKDSLPPSIQGKQTPTGSKQKHGRSGDLFVADPDVPVDAVIVECFEAWRIGTDRNGSSQLTVRRAGSIRARLKEASRGAPDGAEPDEALAFGRQEVLDAAKGMATSVWHRENGHTEFDQLFRNRDRIEAFVKRLQKTQREEGKSAAKRFAAYDAAVAKQQGEQRG